MKVLLIGLGNVGANVAYLSIFNPRIEKLMLYDIQEEMLKGKTLDLCHCLGILKKDMEIIAVDELKGISADLVVITAGKPRREGMSRFDLLDVNVDIFNEIIRNLDLELLRESIFIIVTNPVDVLTYYFYKKTGLKRYKVIGMAGILDTGRFRYYLARKLNKKISELEAIVLGSHSKDMVCIFEEENGVVKEAIEETRGAGAKIVSFLKGGSAYFAPAVGVKVMMDAIVNDKGEILPCVAVLNGEYGYKDIAFGVPVRLSSEGIKEILELQLSQEQKMALDNSIKGVRDSISYLKDKGAL